MKRRTSIFVGLVVAHLAACGASLAWPQVLAPVAGALLGRPRRAA